MIKKKKEHPKSKPGLHERNKHRERYNFKELIQTSPELAPFVKINAYNDESIDFFDPDAVKALNKALLKHFYGIERWSIPENYLCPPIPGRADYIHHIADLLAKINNGLIPRGKQVKCLDIGVGANCIYPIIGNFEYGWQFVGADIDPVSIDSASDIVSSNASLEGNIELRLQADKKDIFRGIILQGEKYDLTICNPPFHASLAESRSATLRKLGNLSKGKIASPKLNFGGQNNELWCEGGEVGFVYTMIKQSAQFSSSCLWFSTLISKQSNLEAAFSALEKVKASDVKVIPMGQGNKISRILAWTFHNQEQQIKWVYERWGSKQ